MSIFITHICRYIETKLPRKSKNKHPDMLTTYLPRYNPKQLILIYFIFQLEIFIQRLSYHKMKLMLCGLFPLDYRLIYSVSYKKKYISY